MWIVYYSKPTFTECTISENVAKHPKMGGGGALIQASRPKFGRTSFLGNIAAHNGGGLTSIDAQTSFEECIISNNSAANSGGGILFTGSSTKFRANCAQWTVHVTNNVARTGSGGGIFIKLSAANLTDSDTSIPCPSIEFSMNSVSSSQYGPNRASSPFRIAVTQQPASTTMPAGAALQSMSMAFEVRDLFNQTCIAMDPANMNLATIPPMFVAGVSSPSISHGQDIMGPTDASGHFGIDQAAIGQTFRIRAIGQTFPW